MQFCLVYRSRKQRPRRFARNSSHTKPTCQVNWIIRRDFGKRTTTRIPDELRIIAKSDWPADRVNLLLAGQNPSAQPAMKGLVGSASILKTCGGLDWNDFQRDGNCANQQLRILPFHRIEWPAYFLSIQRATCLSDYWF